MGLLYSQRLFSEFRQIFLANVTIDFHVGCFLFCLIIVTNLHFYKLKVLDKFKRYNPISNDTYLDRFSGLDSPGREENRQDVKNPAYRLVI